MLEVWSRLGGELGVILLRMGALVWTESRRKKRSVFSEGEGENAGGFWALDRSLSGIKKGDEEGVKWRFYAGAKG